MCWGINLNIILNTKEDNKTRLRIIGLIIILIFSSGLFISLI